MLRLEQAGYTRQTAGERFHALGSQFAGLIQSKVDSAEDQVLQHFSISILQDFGVNFN